MTAPTSTDGTPDRVARSPRWRRVRVGVSVLLAIALVSTADIWSRILRDGAGQNPVVGVTAIELRDDWFHPSVVEVPVGTLLTFVWDDGDTRHDIVFDDGVEAPVLVAGTWNRIVDEPGDVVFRCSLHPGMTGRVVVTG